MLRSPMTDGAPSARRLRSGWWRGSQRRWPHSPSWWRSTIPRLSAPSRPCPTGWRPGNRPVALGEPGSRAHLTRGLGSWPGSLKLPRGFSRNSTCRRPGPGVDRHQGPCSPGGRADLCPGAGIVRPGWRDAELFPTLPGLCDPIATGERCRRHEHSGRTRPAGAARAAPTPRPEAHDAPGIILFMLGEYAMSRRHLE